MVLFGAEPFISLNLHRRRTNCPFLSAYLSSICSGTWPDWKNCLNCPLISSSEKASSQCRESMEKVSPAKSLKYMILKESNRIINSLSVSKSPVVSFPLMLLMLKNQDSFTQFQYDY